MNKTTKQQIFFNFVFKHSGDKNFCFDKDQKFIHIVLR